MSPRFQIGTTSYIIPADIVPNVEHLAGRVDDVELLLFEVESGQGNLPDADRTRRLNEIAARHDLGYTVHLPLDLELGAAGAAGERSLRKAAAVVAATRPLQPRAWVLHLEGRDVLAGQTPYPVWRRRAVAALRTLCDETPSAARLAVENLEGYPLDFLDPVLDRVAVARCIDVGHLWVDGHDPVPYLERHLPRARVVHLHGIGSRDHQSLAHTPVGKLRPVLAAINAASYAGVLTLEVFNDADLRTSLAALQQALPQTERGVRGDG